MADNRLKQVNNLLSIDEKFNIRQALAERKKQHKILEEACRNSGDNTKADEINKDIVIIDNLLRVIL
jgi:hypothetical protein